jgi:hypothetical protein
MAHATSIMFLGASGLSVSQIASFASTPQQCQCSHTKAINAADALLHKEAKANDNIGKFEAATNKVGCYCFGQNCYGNDDGIECWWCVEIARRKDDLPSVEVEPGVCQFDCPICKCNCQATFHENKRHTIANGLEKSANQ